MAAEAPTTWQVAEAVLVDAEQRGKLVGFARDRFGIPPEDADDLLQETALELVRQQAHVENPDGFVFAVFRNRCRRFLEARTRRREVFAPPVADSPSAETACGIDERLALREALSEISSSCRQILAAHYVEGQTLTETARRLALANSGIFKAMTRCLKRLRKCLS
ncbi:MAG TPA: sigma-70 family RNA polymerase sigma factor [Thermoanaerobaculia bacterium]|nr:sigma-70 family RNA polymerase sigma factor [Thermoanaerobaculia bacterium]